MSGAQVGQLLDVSRSNNARLGISGLLLMRERNVMQILEGGQVEVEELLARIAADERHTSVTTVWTSNHDRRRFPEWTMGFDDLTSPPDLVAVAAGWPEPDLAHLDLESGAETVWSATTRSYLQRRAEVLRRALASGDRLTTALAVILHGHRPESVLLGGTRTLRCAECRTTGEPGPDLYPCSTATNAIWALESVRR